MKLIKIDNYWIVVSDEIAGYTSTCKTYNSDGRVGMAENNQSKIIIASNNPEYKLPNITFSEEVAKELGEVDVEQITTDYYQSASDSVIDGFIDGFIDGYNQCKEDNKEKKYTEADIIAIYHLGHQVGMNTSTAIDNQFSENPPKMPNVEEIRDSYIQSLNKQEYDVEIQTNSDSITIIKLLK